MSTALVIHGHFYQPPRENPWTGILEREPSASPDHDWNDRIHRECYRTNAFARIFDGYGHIDRIVNNYAKLSFNFGPTLLSWLESQHPVTYARVLEADRASVLANDGHGNAIAQGYNHAILPLCNPRDRVTQVRWGIADFRHRFGRRPESLWLPETAANDATLGTLIDEGMKYVILSPYQAERVRRIGESTWKDVADGSIDPGVPYLYRHRDGSGRSIAVFFYDGPIARGVAFEGSLTSSQTFVGRLQHAMGGPGRLVHIATDGESYGHHFRFGELSLAYALDVEAPARGFHVTNYGRFLAENPPVWEVEIKPGPNGEGTAWSCAHGVGRWARDCGCNTGGREGWTQAWRAPLRVALDDLRDEIVRQFERVGGDLFRDPWEARDAYVELVLDRGRSREAWLERHAGRSLSSREQERALTLLELSRMSMLMYTSCGWFFSELSGIETVQVMKYAGKALDLIEELDLPTPRARFVEALGEARSNLPEHGTGADIFRKWVEPLRVTPGRVAAHLAILGLVDEGDGHGECAGFRYQRSAFQRQRHGRITLATARIDLEEIATRKRHDYAVASMHLGAVDFYCVARPFPGVQRYATSTSRLWTSLRKTSLPALLRIAVDEFGPDEYSLESMLADGKDRLSQVAFGDIVGRFAQQYISLYESNQRILEMLQEAGLQLPPELMAAVEFTLGHRFEEEIAHARGSLDPGSYAKAVAIAEEVEHRGYKIDRTAAGRVFGNTLAKAVAAVRDNPDRTRIEAATRIAELGSKLGLNSNLVRAQELVYDAVLTHPSWQSALEPLARALGVKVPTDGQAPTGAWHEPGETQTGSPLASSTPTKPSVAVRKGDPSDEPDEPHERPTA